MLLDEINVAPAFANKDVPINNPFQWAQLKVYLNKAFWLWYDVEVAKDPNRVIIKLRKWFLSYDVKVSDLGTIFQWVVGERIYA